MCQSTSSMSQPTIKLFQEESAATMSSPMDAFFRQLKLDLSQQDLVIVSDNACAMMEPPSAIKSDDEKTYSKDELDISFGEERWESSSDHSTSGDKPPTQLRRGLPSMPKRQPSIKDLLSNSNH
ncbi:expressed unknown protein [Seminavis robusta]|uniref:Uncharacterized protein n=1 Tax=Seminavis robusta TaxID=568900 RepID=A0A9N8DG65_9STRA|nr:expressed unknown protein [Seminavis robusta]|eukprot:Sro52_g031160.1 n/a (124) ;mRNA; r:117611-117982